MRRPTERSRLLFIAIAFVLLFSIAGSVFVFGQVQAQDDTPVGEWSVALARTDIPVDIASSFSYVGRWQLGIESDGSYVAERMDVGENLVTGNWTVDGDQITFTDTDGLLACSNAAAAPIVNDDLATGSYRWNRSGKTLTLTRVDDACPGRVILLTTFAFSTFVACTTPPMSLSELMGTPIASPVDEETSTTLATPVAFDPADRDSLASPIAETIPATLASPDATGRDSLASPEPVRLDFASDIDTLLDQLSACWASREPERWLPLLSNEFRTALVQSDPNFMETLTISMSAPVSWERSGDITLEAPNRISAIVKSTTGTQEDFQRFTFVFEDGQWKWNG